MAIDWKLVTSAHVELACDDCDAGDKPASPSRNTFLLARGSRYPAKFIRGRAYRIATGNELDPNRDYSGGQETVRFLVERGFAVEYRGETHLPGSVLPHKGNSKPSRRPHQDPASPRFQKATLERLLRERDGGLQTEARFPWLTVPPLTAQGGVLAGIWRELSHHRGYVGFATAGFSPACDYYLPADNLVLEYDERQHFTIPRALSLAMYPSDMAFGFDRESWIRSCERIDAHDPSPEYRDEQRAYYDAVRDVLAAENGVRLVRVRHGDQDWADPSASQKLRRLLDEPSSRPILSTAAESPSSLKIGLLSFSVDKDHPERTRGNEHVVLDILRSNPDLDLLVGAGWTVFSEDELATILDKNPNPHTVAILETWKGDGGGFEHRGHAIQGSEVLVGRTPQIFATSSEVNGHPELMSALLDEIEAQRQLCVGGKTVTWLICGEINVLANAQLDGNRPDFRFTNDAGLSARWRRIFEGTDIFVDPTHTVMGNQGKLKRRREFLSAGSRIFCSVSNVDVTGRGTVDVKRKLGQVPVQYFWRDGAPQEPDVVRHADEYILRVYTS